MAFWDALKTEKGYPWNPAPGKDQRNDYSIPLYQGTPIVAPVSGIVLDQHTSGGGYYSYYGRQDWGGEVDILTSLPDYPGGMQDVNLLHFDTINVKPGDTVVAGQTVLGTSGGQTSGGNMPSMPKYSQGPHIGVGVHSVQSWDTMYNPWTLISNLLGGRDTSSIPSQAQLQGAGLGYLPRGNVPAGVPLVGYWGGPPKDNSNNSSNNSSNCDQYNIIDPRWYWCNLTTNFGAVIRNFDWSRVWKIGLGLGLIAIGVLLFIGSSIGGDLAAAAVTASGVPEAAPFAARAFGRKTNITRRVGSGIRARGAVAGQRTLKERQAQGEATGRKETLQVIHEERSAASKRGHQTRRERAAERAQGEPVFAAKGDKEPVGFMRGGQYVPAVKPKGETVTNRPAGARPPRDAPGHAQAMTETARKVYQPNPSGVKIRRTDLGEEQRS